MNKQRQVEEFNAHIDALIDFCTARGIKFELGLKIFTYMIITALSEDKAHASVQRDNFIKHFNDIFDKWNNNANKTNS